MRIRPKTISLWFKAVIYTTTLYWLCGFYYGWVDDVWFDMTLAGKLISSGDAHPGFFWGILSILIHGLYETLPNWPIYGMFYVLIILWIHLLAIPVIESIARKVFKDYSLQIILSWLCLSFLLWPHLFAANLTTLSILLGGLSIIHFLQVTQENHNPLSVHWVTLACGLFVAFCMRFTIAIVLAPLLTIAILRAVQYGKKRVIMISLTIVLTFGLPFLATMGTYNSSFQKQHVKLIQVLDSDVGLRINDVHSQEGIKDLALYTWLLGDTSLWGTQRLDDKLVSIEYSLADKWQTNVTNAKQRYPSNYRPEANWFWRATLYSLLSLVVLLYLLFTHSTNLPQLVLSGLTILTILFLGIAYKLEGRAILPMLVLVLIYLLSSIPHQHFVKGKKWPWATGFVMVIFVTASSWKLYQIGHAYDLEVHRKKAWVDSLNTRYSNEVISVDLFAMTLFHGSLTEGLNMPNNVELTSYPELWGVLQALKEGGDLPSPPDYFSSAAQNKTYYLGPQFRVAMLENLLNEVYNTPISFEKIEDCPIEYSFTWDPLNLGIYQINLE